jgi:hypothetical protein
MKFLVSEIHAFLLSFYIFILEGEKTCVQISEGIIFKLYNNNAYGFI